MDETPRPQKALAGTNSKLHPRVVNLMKMLFDLETYKYENGFNKFPPFLYLYINSIAWILGFKTVDVVKECL